MEMNELSTHPSVLSALTALIAPTLLVSACGTFIISTAHRTSLNTDRVRALVARLARLSRRETTAAVARRRTRLEREIELTFGRVLLQQRALGLFYGSAATFVACSLTLGITAVIGVLPPWVPAALGFVGVALLLLACALLLVDAQRLVSDMKEEVAGARREHRTVLSHHEATRNSDGTSPVGSDDRGAGPRP